MKPRLFCLWLLLSVALGVSAYDFQSGDLFYNFNTNNTVEVAKCNTNDGVITIPASIKMNGMSYKVTSIADSAFYNQQSITSLTLPNSLLSIGKFAFAYCRGLTSLSIPNSVISINEYAFWKCTNLRLISIPNSVTSIGNYAFSSCSRLTSVIIPDSVTYIGKYAFSDCNKLTSVTLSNKISSIENGTFINCSSLTTILIPNNVTNIGNRAFSGCRCLTSISIPNSITSIGDDAFAEVPNIMYSGTATGSPWGARNMNGYVDNNFIYTDATKTNLIVCSGAEKGEITIPISVTNIGKYAFSGCNELTAITIPDNVISIEDSAFVNCKNLHKFICENSTVELPNGCIDWFLPNMLDTIAMPANGFDVSEEKWAEMPKCLKYVNITSGEMTDNAFSVLNRSCKTLQTLDIQAVSNTSITDEAFKGCYNLRTLRLPSLLTKIPYMAVADCKSLQEITIPATVEEIDNSAFENCRSIQTIIFEGADTPQGTAQYALAAGCALHRIGNWAFYNCHELQHLTIPEGVTEIGDAAFYGCTYLQDLTLPASVEQIGDNCFALCSKLQKITVLSTTPPAIAAKTFYDVNRAIPVYVPAESVADYKGDIYWKEFNIQANATPIEYTQADESTSTAPRKVVRNGQVLIIRGDKTYTATGVEVK